LLVGDVALEELLELGVPFSFVLAEDVAGGDVAEADQLLFSDGVVELGLLGEAIRVVGLECGVRGDGDLDEVADGGKRRRSVSGDGYVVPVCGRVASFGASGPIPLFVSLRKVLASTA
jgi:hypothetical protein